ncbi:MAG TPA: MCD, Malonyl-CoA decarboxylase MCD, partial [Pseudomonadaceae bacterium]|nr:MCD, Malonyl-CoA decarboxylase MCD [Pseudomonadaceae bacterium]
DERLPDTAMFYSINNCLQGLRGVSFGSFLIKRVIERLSAEAPHIQNFVTLSPVPGFMRWLRAQPSLDTLLEDTQLASVQALLARQEAEADYLQNDKDLRDALLFLCAHYLVNEKSRGSPADAVARFHLGNGARLEQINWLADSSPNGLQQAAGLMVNYVYDLKQLARNHEAYQQRREVACSAAIRKLL